MADWIKMRKDLPDDPAVFKLAGILKLDRLSVVGRLYAFWAWADKHAVDGRVDGATSHVVDDVAHLPGFSDALESVGWLLVGENHITIPKHERHNGESAKERELKNARQARWRKGKASTPSTKVDAVDTTPASTRREESRVDNAPKPPRAPRQARLTDVPIQPHVALMEAFGEEYEERFKEPHPFQKSNLRAASEAVSRGVTPEMVVEKANMAWDHKEEWMRSACMTFQGLWKQWPKLIQTNGHRVVRTGNF